MKNGTRFLVFALALSFSACGSPVNPKPPALPGAPSDVRIEPSGSDTALLWSAVSEADTYTIYFSSDDSTYDEFGSTAGTSYLLPLYGYYKVAGKNETGEGPKSSAAYHERPAASVAETPAFSETEGTYDESLSIGLSCATPGATLYYTLDGSTPSVGNSPAYSASIPVAAGTTVTITAIAAATGYSNSDAAIGTFHVRGWGAVGSAGFSDGEIWYVSLAVDSESTPYIAFMNSQSKAEVMKFQGTTWSTLGGSAISAGVAPWTTIAVDSADSIYIAYKDNSISPGKGTVRKYSGSSWTTLGVAGFSAGSFIYPSLAMFNDGSTHTPFIAYQDGGNGGKATVMKYESGSWVSVGAAGFSSGTVEYVSLAVAGDGAPYVAYRDGATVPPNKATLMKFNGDAWGAVDSAGFSDGTVLYVSLALSSGTPHVAYQDGSSSNKATVRTFSGSWVDVGASGFSSGAAEYVSMAISGGGVPYVAYKDGAESGKATVMKFDGGSWVLVGAAGFSPGTVEYLDFVLAPDGTPFVAFKDGNSQGRTTVMAYR